MEQFYRYGVEFTDWYETLPLVAVKEFAAEREQINGREFEEERIGD